MSRRHRHRGTRCGDIAQQMLPPHLVASRSGGAARALCSAPRLWPARKRGAAASARRNASGAARLSGGESIIERLAEKARIVAASVCAPLHHSGASGASRRGAKWAWAIAARSLIAGAGVGAARASLRATKARIDARRREGTRRDAYPPRLPGISNAKWRVKPITKLIASTRASRAAATRQSLPATAAAQQHHARTAGGGIEESCRASFEGHRYLGMAHRDICAIASTLTSNDA